MAKQVLRGNRSIDRATITALARYAGLNLPEDRVVAQLEGGVGQLVEKHLNIIDAAS